MDVLAPQFGICDTTGVQRERNCRQKRRYTFRDDAKGEAKRLGRLNRVKLGVYRCPVCDGWHLTKRRGYGTE